MPGLTEFGTTVERITMYRYIVIAMATVAVTVSGTSTAMASPVYSPLPTKKGITGGSEVSLLEGALTVKCMKDTILSGGIVSATHTKLDIDCETASVLGIPVNSSADGAGVILIFVEYLLCYLGGSTKASPKVGAFTEVSNTVVIEGVGVKSELKGSLIGEVRPINKKQKTGELVYKKTNPTSCTTENEGKGTVKTASLLANLNGGEFKKAEEERIEKLTFQEELEVKA